MENDPNLRIFEHFNETLFLTESKKLNDFVNSLFRSNPLINMSKYIYSPDEMIKYSKMLEEKEEGNYFKEDRFSISSFNCFLSEASPKSILIDYVTLNRINWSLLVRSVHPLPPRLFWYQEESEFTRATKIIEMNNSISFKATVNCSNN